MTLHLPDSGAVVALDGARTAPSALRNLPFILAQLAQHAPPAGPALELASGTGQQIAAFAAAHPGLDWQPTDVNPDNLTSITAWRTRAMARSGCANLAAPMLLDAGQPGWGVGRNLSLVLAVNLLHLIPEAHAATLLAEASTALAPGGVVMIYGPFLRHGQATSDGDAAFDASLRAQNPLIGYKDRDWATGNLRAAGLLVHVEALPANNLMLIAFKN